MEMGYDSTELTYTVKAVLVTRLLLTAREGHSLVTEMLISASTDSKENRLARVMSPKGIAEPEKDAVEPAANR
ncbi:hypothetical protein J7E88_28285 [Streptomyces sp. ISL-10]|uniref:hypothetical protein n=1 Tax=Streptomyces sp. ISL-10 TaxID=2819172 RepID=UPI001BEC001D|nr:hypothetical protein [Streptomyces sp. ISL-10]MBT2369110.1 hypothetical protein [Streptomyces sp. ISL-10]